jgi:hypothetical protein
LHGLAWAKTWAGNVIGWAICPGLKWAELGCAAHGLNMW